MASTTQFWQFHPFLLPIGIDARILGKISGLDDILRPADIFESLTEDAERFEDSAIAVVINCVKALVRYVFVGTTINGDV